MLITIVVPVVLLVFFGAVAATPPDFLVPGLLALAVMSTSMVSLGIATAYERYYGALKRLLGSPLPRTSLIAAKTLSVLVIELVQVVLLIGIARLMFDWSPGGSLIPALLALILGTAAFAGLGLLMAGTLRAEATLAVANGLYLVFLLLGGFILPLDRLPGPIDLVAHAHYARHAITLPSVGTNPLRETWGVQRPDALYLSSRFRRFRPLLQSAVSS